MDLFKLSQKVPKVELHAHLNGSLSEKTLLSLGVPPAELGGYNIIKNVDSNSPDKINECFKLFKVAHNATKTVNAVYTATKHVIDDFYKDNVIYLELRTTPRQEKNMTRQEYIEAVIKAIKENNSIITVKLILSIDRRHGIEESKKALNVILDMHEMHPKIIKGVDLCGNPNEGAFFDELFTKARDRGLKITLHCGEVKNDEEVAKLLLFRPDRIGHGTCIHPHYGGSDELWKLYKTVMIPIECCVTSNVLCGTTSSYDKHHVGELIQNDLPFSLNTDDKGVFLTSLSEELFYVVKNYNLPKAFLIDHWIAAIKYSFASEKEKKDISVFLENWKKQNIGIFKEAIL